MIRLFLSAYDFFTRRKKLLALCLALTVAALAAVALQIRFKEDIASFLSGGKENQRIQHAYRYVASSSQLVVYCVTLDSTDETKAAQIEAIEHLATQLATLDSSYVKELFYKIDPTMMADVTAFIAANLPYFLNESDYDRIDSLLTPDAIARQLAGTRQLLLSPAGMVMRDAALSDPLGFAAPVMRRLQELQVSSRFKLYQDYVFTDRNEAFLLIESPIPVSETDKNVQLIDSLRTFIARTEAAMQGQVEIRSFGAAEIALENASQIRKDSMVSSLLALVLIAALLAYTFRSAKNILLILAAALFGGLFALASMYVLRGEVSFIAVGISSIMFGIAINYPLHFIDHYNHVPRPRRVIKDIFEPLTIGNITTVGAFLSLVFIGSDAMIDLGLFASLLLIGTILFVLLFLPHMLRNRRRPTAVGQHSLLTRVVSRPFEKNSRIVGATLLLTLFFSLFSGNSKFEADMNSINYMTDAQRTEYENVLGLLNQHQHIVYCVTEGRTLNDALEAAEAMEPKLQQQVDSGRAIRIGSASNFYPSEARQAERAERWNRFWESRRDSVQHAVRQAAQAAGFKPDAFAAFETVLDRTWEAEELSHFDPLKPLLARNYLIELDDRAMAVNLIYTSREHAPHLETALNGEGTAVVFDTASITRQMIASLSDNFNYVLYVCGLLVFLFLMLSMGRIELSLIAFAPLALSWVWILGIMNMTDIRFNIVNIILATFIFGQGDDYTVFMLEGLMYEYTYRRKILSSYKSSIALSALIMFIGIGMLILAKHPALRSLAEVTIVGMLSVVVMSYIFPSLLFHALTMRKNGTKRPVPITLRNLLMTLYVFVGFLIGSALLTGYGWLLFGWGRRATEAKKMRYHRFLCRLSRFVSTRIPRIKSVFLNPHGETFDRPSVIICNHQSHLDLLYIMMLTPKLIVLTNDWVWRSPFYGRLIRYADFYPVSNGIEQALEQLRETVARGYSIVVFPEGTRSDDCSIRRFHRGAFYLAEQLQLDIVPVLLHGVGHVLPKSELILRKGIVHVEVMERITPDDTRFAPDYSTRSREVRRFYRTRYAELAQRIETPDYFADRVVHNYIYKGAAVERAVRRELRMNNNYTDRIASLPDSGRIVIEGCGYGVLTLLLAFVKPQAEIIGIEPDDDLRELAANCPSLPPNLRYVKTVNDIETNH